MRKEQTLNVTWVVYKMNIHGKPSEVNAVCEQAEWDAMERERPGGHTLVMAGIPNEGDAEKLARGTAGDAKKRLSATKA